MTCSLLQVTIASKAPFNNLDRFLTLPIDTCWKAGLCKHTLNVPVNHYLENAEIMSSLYIPIKQNM